MHGTINDTVRISGKINNSIDIKGSFKSDKITGTLSNNEKLKGTLTSGLNVVASLSGGVGLTATIGVSGITLPNYDGEYTIIPKVEDQILETKNRITRENITVKEIPYSETSNIYGYTVNIG